MKMELEQLVKETANDYDLGSKVRNLVESGEFKEEEIKENENFEEKYIRLAAEFDNFRKRVNREKEEIIFKAKASLIEPILDIDNDISIASKHSNDEGVKLIVSKMSKILSSLGIEEVQTENYDEDLHEVISVIQTGEISIHEVVSKGYKIGDKVIRYPKIILTK